MRVTRLFAAGFTAALLLPASALAETDAPEHAEESWLARLDPSIVLGGGVTSFVNPSMRDNFGPGASWTVRGAIGPKREVRAEVSYVGSAQRVQGEAVGEAELVGHGVHGALRMNFWPDLVVEPILLIGAGWTRFGISSSMTAPGLRRTDHVLEIPLAAGVAYRHRGFVFDARAGFTIVSGADLLSQMDPTTSQDSENMHRVSMQVSVGYEL